MGHSQVILSNEYSIYVSLALEKCPLVGLHGGWGAWVPKLKTLHHAIPTKKTKQTHETNI